MNVKQIEEQRNLYVMGGKSLLNAARVYLNDYCDEWNSEHHKEWTELLERAAEYLIKAQAMNDLMKL